MKLPILGLVIFTLCACTTSGYKQFYSPSNLPAEILATVEPLEEGETPEVFGTDNFDRDIKILMSKRYVVIGESSFNGGYEDLENARKQALLVGSHIVLVNSQYTNTQTTTTPLFLPDNQTTYHSGTVSGNTTYSSPSGTQVGSSTSTGVYSGTSTTHGTKVVPITSHQRRYDQNAVYLAKSNQKWKFGAFFEDLTPELRRKYERNLGVTVKLVVDKTPAFFANILEGDVIVSVDNLTIVDADHFSETLDKLNKEDMDDSVFTLLRNGEERELIVRWVSQE